MIPSQPKDLPQATACEDQEAKCGRNVRTDDRRFATFRYMLRIRLLLVDLPWEPDCFGLADSCSKALKLVRRQEPFALAIRILFDPTNRVILSKFAPDCETENTAQEFELSVSPSLYHPSRQRDQT